MKFPVRMEMDDPFDNLERLVRQDLYNNGWSNWTGILYNNENQLELFNTTKYQKYDRFKRPLKHFADDFHEGKDGDYVYSGDLKDAQQQAYSELSADGLPPGGDAQVTRDANKLAEEIAGGSVDLGYIFESPDGGETLYKRKVGESERELISKKDFKEYSRNREGVKVNDTKK